MSREFVQTPSPLRASWRTYARNPRSRRQGAGHRLSAKKYLRRSFGRTSAFRYNSLGLSQTPAPQLLARLAWALAVLSRPKGVGTRAELAMACLRRIRDELRLERSRRFKLLNFVHTYAKLDEQSAPEYWDLLHAAENQEVQEMLVTWADEMKAEGHRQGLEEGIEKGRAKGQAQLLMRQAKRKFGYLDDKTRRRIEVADEKALLRAADRLLTASKLSDLF